MAASALRNCVVLPNNITPIQSFYAGKDVFITGGLGFLGKVLVEKLLWACPEINRIHLLARGKKNMDAHTRVQQFLENDVIFSRLKKDVPRYKEKVNAIEGDCGKPNLGMDEINYDNLLNKAHVIFHVAANVNFNQPIKVSLDSNVYSTVQLLKMSKEVKELKSFIHVSTAFSQCSSPELDEKFYSTYVDPIDLYKFVNSSDQKLIQEITPSLVRPPYNNYAFTKALAEDAVRQLGVGIPVGVFRPSVVLSSYQEPLPRWVDNYNGITGYYAYQGIGVQRSAQTVSDNIPINIVPVDMCVNALIASAWDVAESFENKYERNHKFSSDDITMYNYVTGENEIELKKSLNMARKDALKYPSLNTLRYPALKTQKSEAIHKILTILLQDIPAYLTDLVPMLCGQETKRIKMCKKFRAYDDAVRMFTTVNWRFSNKNVDRLIATMTPEDRKLFFCDMKDVNWEEYFDTFFLGLRRYLLNEEDATLPKAKRKLLRLKATQLAIQLAIFTLLAAGGYQVYMATSHTDPEILVVSAASIEETSNI